MALEERRPGDLRKGATASYLEECWPEDNDPVKKALEFLLCPRLCHLVTPLYLFTTGLIHFLLGYVSSSLGLSLPVTIAYTAYQVYDSYTHLNTAPNNKCKLLTKYRLRRDTATYIAGLIIQHIHH